jgi:hypothetical protein
MDERKGTKNAFCAHICVGYSKKADTDTMPAFERMFYAKNLVAAIEKRRSCLRIGCASRVEWVLDDLALKCQRDIGLVGVVAVHRYAFVLRAYAPTRIESSHDFGGCAGGDGFLFGRRSRAAARWLG